jgi:hypothetical protein
MVGLRHTAAHLVQAMVDLLPVRDMAPPLETMEDLVHQDQVTVALLWAVRHLLAMVAPHQVPVALLARVMVDLRRVMVDRLLVDRQDRDTVALLAALLEECLPATAAHHRVALPVVVDGERRKVRRTASSHLVDKEEVNSSKRPWISTLKPRLRFRQTSRGALTAPSRCTCQVSG